MPLKNTCKVLRLSCWRQLAGFFYQVSVGSLLACLVLLPVVADGIQFTVLKHESQIISERPVQLLTAWMLYIHMFREIVLAQFCFYWLCFVCSNICLGMFVICVCLRLR